MESTNLRGAELTGEKTGRGEDAGADHVRDHERGGAADAELSKEAGGAAHAAPALVLTHSRRILLSGAAVAECPTRSRMSTSNISG